MNNRSYFSTLFSNLTSIDQALGLTQNAVNKTTAEKKAVLEALENGLKLLAATAQLKTDSSLRRLLDQASLNQRARKILQQKAAIEDQTRAIQAEIDIQITEMQTEDRSLMADLSDIYKSNVDSLAKALYLKNKLALLLRETIYRLSIEAAHTKNVDKFNKQFSGYAQLSPQGQFVFLGTLEQGFSGLSFSQVQTELQKILVGTDTAIFGRSDSLKALNESLKELARQAEFQLDAGAQKRPVFINNGIEFEWTEAIISLDQVSERLYKQLETRQVQHEAASAMATLQLRLSGIKNQLAGYAVLNEAYPEEIKADNTLAEIKASSIQKVTKICEDFQIRAAASPMGGRFNYEAQKIATVQHLKELNDSLADIKDIDTLNKTQQAALLERMNLHVSAAVLSTELFDKFEAIKVAHDAMGNAGIPAALNISFTRAFDARAKLVAALLSKQPAINHQQDLMRELGGLSVQDIRAMQMCRLLKATIQNYAYWNQQTSCFGGQKASSGVRVTTGDKQMDDVLINYSKQPGDWMANPDTAKKCLNDLKQIAIQRMNYKFCYFFNPGRTAGSSEFLHFLSQLDVEKLSNQDFIAAAKLESVDKAVNNKKVVVAASARLSA